MKKKSEAARMKDDRKTLIGKAAPVLRSFLPLLAALPGLLAVLYYVIGPAEGYMTSDCTDSLRWGQATLLSGRLISQNFNYAAILPFGGNLIFLPFLAIFGYSVKAQIWGLACFVLLFAGGIYYLARGLKMSPASSGGMVSVILLLLSSSAKMREIFWEHIFYYNLGILFFCWGFGLVLRLREDLADGKPAKKVHRRSLVRVLILMLLTVLVATDGLQALICYTLPLIVALAADLLLSADVPLFAPENRRQWLLALLIFIASALGFLLIAPISGGVQAGYANGYSAFSSMSEWTNNLMKLFSHWFSLFGISVTDGQSFVQLDSIFAALRLVLALFVLVMSFVIIFRLPRIRDRALRMLVAGHAAVTAFILFATVFGRLSGASWRLSPMLGTAILACYAYAADLLREKKDRLLIRGGAILMAALCVLALFPAAEIAKMPADYGQENNWHIAARTLSERGLKYGYANFWWAELITMLGNEQVQLENIEVKDGTPQVRSYQQYKDSYQDKETDEYFLLLTGTEKEACEEWLAGQEALGKISGSFTIYCGHYSKGGLSGDTLYVYLFPENLF